MLFVHDEPQPLLDTNMARVLERFFGPRLMADIRYDPYLQALAKEVVSCDDAIRVNWAVLDLAALVCRLRNPNCGHCPLTSRCQFAGDINPRPRHLVEARRKESTSPTWSGT
jgi:A/G-specific adenine glycosylase